MTRPNYVPYWIAVIASLALLVGTSLFNMGLQPNSHQPEATGLADPAKLVNLSFMLDQVEHSVLEIETTATSTDAAGQVTSGQFAGSAWVIDQNGTLVTNAHVIKDAKKITATTIEGRSYPAQTIEVDEATDIALLKLHTGVLPVLKVADTTGLRVGDWVVTVGNPLGNGISAKQGIISRLGVRVDYSESLTYKNMIEVSCAINPGNSGGPLINLDGEVIGITTVKVADVGIEGMGYAKNMADSMPVIQQLLAKK